MRYISTGTWLSKLADLWNGSVEYECSDVRHKYRQIGAKLSVIVRRVMIQCAALVIPRVESESRLDHITLVLGIIVKATSSGRFCELDTLKQHNGGTITNIDWNRVERALIVTCTKLIEIEYEKQVGVYLPKTEERKV